MGSGNTVLASQYGGGEMKNVTIVIPGASEADPLTAREVSIPPGTTVRQVLQNAGLTGFHLRSESGEFLAESDNLYQRADTAGKVFAVPRMQVGR